MRTYAQLTTSVVVFVNRVGIEESIAFWGGSEVIAPAGRPIFTAPLFEEGVHVVEVDPQDVRRERIALPLLRDERPEFIAREYERIVAERAGIGTTPADPMAAAACHPTTEPPTGHATTPGKAGPTRAGRGGGRST
jgi:hypothetical protein